MHQFDKKLNKMHKDIELVLHTCQEGKLTYLGAQVAIRDNKIITVSTKNRQVRACF